MVGFEPTVSCSRSTRPKKQHRARFSHTLIIEERPARIELAIPPWQGDGLPLHHGRLLLAQPNCQRSEKFEVRKVKCENFKLRTSQFKLLIVGSVGIEPTSTGLRVRCITLSATIPFVFVFQVGVEGIEPSTHVL